MSSYIKCPVAQSEAMHEAIGRLYAESLDEVWPIRATINGEPDPDLSHATFYYVDPQMSADETEVAFAADSVVQAMLGQTVETTLGEVTIPASTVELGEEWFLPPPEDPRG